MKIFPLFLLGPLLLKEKKTPRWSKFFTLRAVSAFKKSNTRETTSCLQKLSPFAKWWQNLLGAISNLNPDFSLETPKRVIANSADQDQTVLHCLQIV